MLIVWLINKKSINYSLLNQSIDSSMDQSINERSVHLIFGNTGYLREFCGRGTDVADMDGAGDEQEETEEDDGINED